MKVSLAAQIFSQWVSSTMRGFVKFGQAGLLNAKAADTADFLLFVDKVFDSVNASKLVPEHGKLLRSAVTNDSPHTQFWQEAIRVFSTVQFSSAVRGYYIPPTVKNWVTTLQGFTDIWKKLKNDGFKFLCTRNINQDPLENFFGCIRSHGIRNINPTCVLLLLIKVYWSTTVTLQGIWPERYCVTYKHAKYVRMGSFLILKNLAMN